MYWSMSGRVIDVLLFGVLLAFLWTGGWLLARHVFRLRTSERLIIGLALGLILFVFSSNIIARFADLRLSYWLSAGMVLLAGMLAARPQPIKTWFSMDDLQVWPQLIGLFLIMVLFVFINRGLAIWDDDFNLPLTSTIAAGDFPPHFIFDPARRYAFHYGIHLFAASLMRVGGLFPWSALDITKSLVIALSLVVVWSLYKRWTRSSVGAFLGAVLVAFGGGARWLLLLLPDAWLTRLSSELQLLGSAATTGPDLATNLSKAWSISGGPPVDFPFAIASGIFETPTVVQLAARGAFPLLFAATLLLLWRSSWSRSGLILFSIVLGASALFAEDLTALILIGLMTVFLVRCWHQRRSRSKKNKPSSPILWIILLSGLIVLLQGGVVTEIARNALNVVTDGSSQASSGFGGFRFHWPPDIISAHLGALKFSKPLHWLAALAEMGPVIFFAAFFVSPWAWKRLRSGNWMLGGMGLGALIVFFIAIFFQYGVFRDTARLMADSLFVWLLFGGIVFWYMFSGSGWLVRAILIVLFLITVISGILFLGYELTAINAPQLSYYLQGQDARMARDLWDNLEDEAQVFDRFAYRSVVIFGRAIFARESLYASIPEWNSLVGSYDPIRIAKSGYSYIYMDELVWRKLGADQLAQYDLPCVHLIQEYAQNKVDGQFRRLYDVQACNRDNIDKDS